MVKIHRPTVDEYFMEIARATAKRSTCPRLSVGCIITHNNIIIGTGYNGSVRGAKHCTEVGCLMVDNHCIRAVHAEQNAVVHTVMGKDYTAYVTQFPCPTCAKLLIQLGVTRLVCTAEYYDKHSDGIFYTAGVLTVEVT